MRDKKKMDYYTPKPSGSSPKKPMDDEEYRNWQEEQRRLDREW